MIEFFNLLTLTGGSFLVFSHSPYFSALGLILVVSGFSGLLFYQQLVFMGLVLLLIYLGGMMVVFAYSAALAADIYPKGSSGKLFSISFLTTLYLMTRDTPPHTSPETLVLTLQEDLLSTGELYNNLIHALLLGGFGLLLCLVVILFMVQVNGLLRKI